MSPWHHLLLALMLGSSTAAAASVGSTSSATDARLSFRVLLDGDPIGQHRFELRVNGDTREVISQADFTVRFLFLNIYQYHHTATERWHGNCLVSLTARTDDNGDIETVDANPNGDALAVKATNSQGWYTGCVRTFAYWNPSILDGGRLLNAQTGEYMPVRIQPMGEDVLPANGGDVPTQRYRLIGDGVQIDLWYTHDKQWVALESRTEDGRHLRYERH